MLPTSAPVKVVHRDDAISLSLFQPLSTQSSVAKDSRKNEYKIAIGQFLTSLHHFGITSVTMCMSPLKILLTTSCGGSPMER